MTNPEPYLMLLGFIAVCFVPALAGIPFRPGSWYRSLDKPSWQPPSRVFAPVWTVLYLTIAVSGWLVWRGAGFEGAALPFLAYGLQLLLNALWTPIFFGLKRLGLALATLVLIWLSIIATILLFHPIHSGAAWLLSPYFLWVSFALALNFVLWQRNPPTPDRADRAAWRY